MVRQAVNPAEIAVLALIGLVTLVFFLDLDNYSPATRLVPAIFIALTALLLAARLAAIARAALGRSAADRDGEETFQPAMPAVRGALVIASVLLYLPLIHLVGLYGAIAPFVFVFALVIGRIGWGQSAAIAAGTWAGAFVVFDRVLGLPRPEGILF